MQIQLSNISRSKKLILINFLLLSVLVPVPTLYAAAPNITGAVDITIQTGTITNVATGIGSIAQVGIGSVSDGDSTLTGFTTDITVGDVINQAVAQGSCAQILIGTLGFPMCGGGGGAAAE
ncbi:MAG: hypothetical protein V4629_12125 [Pseudomonadota bacterium]